MTTQELKAAIAEISRILKGRGIPFPERLELKSVCIDGQMLIEPVARPKIYTPEMNRVVALFDAD